MYWVRIFLPRRFAAYPFLVEMQSEIELISSVDSVVAPICVITLWSLASWFSATGTVR